jgi:hypothetical protein
MARISIRQNQYIFVFTVTTVIYLPLGFVTVSIPPFFANRSLLTRRLKSIFGMHLFDTTDPGVVAARRKFYIAIIVLSMATYAAAFVAYWLARSRKEDPTNLDVQNGKVKEQGGEEVPQNAEGKKMIFEKSILSKGAGLGFLRW